MLETYVNASRLRKLPKFSWWAVSNQLTDIGGGGGGSEWIFLLWHRENKGLRTMYSTEMEFYDIKLTKDSSLSLHAIHSRFYWRIQKNILYSGYIIRETRKLESIHE